MRLGTDELAKNVDLYRNEQSQTRVRIGICLFMAVYFSITGYTNHPLYVFFIVYCLALYGLVRISGRFSSTRIIVSIAVDNFCTIAGLHVTGEQGTFLFVLLIQITLGNGLRYGRYFLWFSVITACIGLTSLYHYSIPWKGNVHLALAYLLGVPFVAFYIDYLVRELQNSRSSANRRAAEVEELLAFVAHDVRTPLHALLTTTSIAKADASDDISRIRLTRIETGIRSLARLTTNVLGAAATHTNKSHTMIETVSLHTWVVQICRQFADEIEARATTLTFAFDFSIPTLIAFDTLIGERLFTNALSNAARFSGGGEIEIKLERAEGNGNPLFRLSVSNRDDRSTNSSVPGQTSWGRNEKYHGSRMGLSIATEIASSAGGGFRYSRTKSGLHTAIFELPFIKIQHGFENPISYPVLIASADERLISHFKSTLSAETTVIAFRNLETLLQATSLRAEPIAALFLDDRMLLNTYNGEILRENMPAFYPACLVRSNRDPHSARRNLPIFSELNQYASREEIMNAVYANAAFRECPEVFLPNLRLSLERRLGGSRLLFVDDNQTNLNLVEETLKYSTIEFEVATNVEEALSKLKTRRFDAALMDWHLGNETSDSIVEEVAKNRSLDGTKIFIFSAERADRIELFAIKDRVSKIIERPIDLSNALSLVADLLHGDVSSRSEVIPPRGSRLFDVSIYDELAIQGTSAERIREVLRRFKQELDELRSQIDASLSAENLADLRKAMHGLKSVCLAAGAHALGDCIENSGPRVENYRTQDLPAFRELAMHISDLSRLTESHIAWYSESLRLS